MDLTQGMRNCEAGGSTGACPEQPSGALPWHGMQRSQGLPAPDLLAESARCLTISTPCRADLQPGPCLWPLRLPHGGCWLLLPPWLHASYLHCTLQSLQAWEQ